MRTFKVSLEGCIVTQIYPDPTDVTGAAPNFIDGVEYQINSGPLIIITHPFLQSDPCGYPISYSLAVMGFKSVPSFITFTFDLAKGGTITIDSSKRSDYLTSSQYQIVILASLSQASIGIKQVLE